MKKFITVVLCCVMAVISLTGCAVSPEMIADILADSQEEESTFEGEMLFTKEWKCTKMRVVDEVLSDETLLKSYYAPKLWCTDGINIQMTLGGEVLDGEIKPTANPGVYILQFTGYVPIEATITEKAIIMEAPDAEFNQLVFQAVESE